MLKDRVRELRPLFMPPDPASRTEYQPGELAQCDLWFPPVDVPLGAGQAGRPPVLVMVAGYSRVMTARMIPSRQAPDLLAGHWALISGLGAVPRSLVWDNESAVGQWRGGRPVLTEAMNGFRGTLGITVIQCRPRDPEAKGLVERANGYLETSFLPGRRFAGPADFNAQLAGWLVRANTRQHRGLGCRPADRWDADRAAMLGLPPVAPVTGWRISTRLPRDHYVRLDSNDYSVHPSVIGRKVEVTLRSRECRAGDSLGPGDHVSGCGSARTTARARPVSATIRVFQPRVAASSAAICRVCCRAWPVMADAAQWALSKCRDSPGMPSCSCVPPPGAGGWKRATARSGRGPAWPMRFMPANDSC